ncbi:hypothetical protein DMA11_16445 [Marinilabiliaceae bacterium JC017]|nr:hypothetical protein DMA11_16445 [Marinilabiliaceae bacterium JC017]
MVVGFFFCLFMKSGKLQETQRFFVNEFLLFSADYDDDKLSCRVAEILYFSKAFQYHTPYALNHKLKTQIPNL